MGAAAALTGLIFVGLSINLTRILSLPFVANRGLQALLLLLGVVGVDTVVLVPGLTLVQYGIGVLGIGVSLWFVLDEIERRTWKHSDPKFRPWLVRHTLEIQIPCALIVIAGVVFLFGSTQARVWLVPATLVCYLVTVTEAWVLLVEINR